MDFKSINIADKLAGFSEQWSPKVIVWHDHKETDELFVVIDSEMTIHFRDGNVPVKMGELFVVPKGVEHMTSAKVECHAMLIEPAGTVNTGDKLDEKTAPVDSWI